MNSSKLFCAHYHILIFFVFGLADARRSYKIQGVPSVVVELEILCDYDFSATFQYNRDEITNYWFHEIEDLNVQFQTLSRANVTFLITSVVVINDKSDQPFIEKSRTAFNTVKLQPVLNNFTIWAYQNINSIRGDVVLLVTGLNGPEKSHCECNEACKIDHADRRFSSFLVLRSGKSQWHKRLELAVGMAKLLGASADGEVSSPRSGNIMDPVVLQLVNWLNFAPASTFYFSECSDELIFNFLVSKSAICLHNITHATNSLRQNVSPVALSREEQCQKRALVTNPKTAGFEILINDNDGCLSTKCTYRDAGRNRTIDFSPSTNSPCGGDSRICFRGQCVHIGHMFYSNHYNSCILANGKFSRNNSVYLRDCPQEPKRFEEFQLLDNAGEGIYIATLDRFTFSRCLTVDSQEKYVLLEKCPGTFQKRFLWELIEVGNGSRDILICHKVSRKCADAHKSGAVIMTSVIPIPRLTQRWSFKYSQIRRSHSSKLVKDMGRLYTNGHMMIGVPKYNIRLTIVCDKDFSKLFNFDRQRITDYWTHEIKDLEILFGTLPSTSISFSISSIGVIKNTAQQPFLEPNDRFGVTYIPQIHDDFDTWVTLQKDKFDTDIVVLVTRFNASSTFSSRTFKNCHKRNSTIWGSIVVGTGLIGNWHTRWSLGNSIATLFNAKDDSKTKCKGLGHAADGQSNITEESFFFSSCTDSSIHEYVVSSNDDCFETVRKQKHTQSVQSSTIYPPSLEDQCNFKYPGSVLMDTNSHKMLGFEPICFLNNCIRESNSDVYRFFPVYNSPCAPNKFCFRSRCLERGFMIQNEPTEQCLMSTDAFSYNDSLQLNSCPNITSRQNEFSANHTFGVGQYISVPYTNTEQLDKCLTVSLDGKHIVFDKCPVEESPRFGWDIIETAEDPDNVLLCHRTLKRCASATARSEFPQFAELKLMNESDLTQRWRIVNDLATSNGSLVETTKLGNIIQFYGLDVAINVAVFCDLECASLFQNDIKIFTEYWNVIMFTMYTKFQSIPEITVEFKVITIQFLEESVSKELVVDKRKFSGNTNLNLINKNFKRWVQTEVYNTKSKYNIALLLTGSYGYGIRSNVELKSVCQTNENKELPFSTMVIRIGNTELEFCDQVSSAFGAALGSDSTLFLRHANNCEISDDRSCHEPYFYSECQSQRIKNYLASKHAFCLRKGNKLERSYFPNQNIPLSVPSMTTQCKIFTTDLTAFTLPEEENCRMTSCQKTVDNGVSSIGHIYPMTYTPCGFNMHCFGSRCITKGFQVENVAAGLCLPAINNLSNDTIHLDKCLKISSPLEEIMIIDDGLDGFLLKSYYINLEETFAIEKCLTYDSTSRAVYFMDCPENSTNSFSWNMKNIEDKDNEFLITVNNLCLKSEGDLRVTVGSCSGHNPSYHWKYFKKPSSAAIDEIKVNEDESNDVSGMALSAIVVCTCLGLIGATWLGCVIYRRWRIYRYYKLTQDMFYKGDQQNLNDNVDVSDQAMKLPFDKSWEFPITRLIYGKDLGSGAFGRVISAKAIGIREDETETRVAVKTLRTGAEEVHFEALKRELKILSHLGLHVNLVSLLGACTKYLARKELWVILEFCPYGSIHTYLLNHGKSLMNQHGQSSNHCKNETVSKFLNLYPNMQTDQMKSTNNPTTEESTKVQKYDGDYQDLETNPIKLLDLLCWAYQIARGMDYLTSKRVLHGDLATRNILLAENNVVKICDFGFSKELRKNYDYNYKKDIEGALLPIKWMAIESIEFGLFSAESDCWSYGVVLWEIFSLGKTPFPGVNVDESFIKRLRDGFRMEKPELAPSHAYDVMLQCWNVDKSERPKFSELVNVFADLLGDNLNREYPQLMELYRNIEIQMALTLDELKGFHENLDGIRLPATNKPDETEFRRVMADSSASTQVSKRPKVHVHSTRPQIEMNYYKYQ